MNIMKNIKNTKLYKLKDLLFNFWCIYDPEYINKLFNSKIKI